MKKMWHFKRATVPVIVVALSMINKVTDELMKKISGYYSLYDLKNALFGTAHLRRRVI